MHCDQPPVEVSADLDIPAPACRPSDIKDSWRENNIKDEELHDFKKIKTGSIIRRPRRRKNRNSDKTGMMLMEMKHTLKFIEEYNRGYLK